MKAYSIKRDITITLCSDNYVRVVKKHPENGFAIEPLYAISKTQSVVLLLFAKPKDVYKRQVKSKGNGTGIY